MTTRMTRLAAALGALLASAMPSSAQEAEGHCSGAAFADTIGVARVAKARGRINFVRGVHDDKQCPSAAPACRDRPFLVSGDVVLTTVRRGDFVCADYVNAKGVETIGWLPAAALVAVSPAPLTTAGWQGTWRRIEAVIHIKPVGNGALVAGGSATYGAFDAERVASGRVNSGDFSGRATPSGDTLFISDPPAVSFEAAPETSCAVRMRRIASYMLVEDNKGCGGMNVSFTGIYVKR